MSSKQVQSSVTKSVESNGQKVLQTNAENKVFQSNAKTLVKKTAPPPPALPAKEDPMEICKFCALEFMPKVLEGRIFHFEQDQFGYLMMKITNS